jgi:hypothetical protein
MGKLFSLSVECEALKVLNGTSPTPDLNSGIFTYFQRILPDFRRREGRELDNSIWNDLPSTAELRNSSKLNARPALSHK